VRTVAGAALAALLLAAPAGAAAPGVTAGRILIGGTGPLSGLETAYAPVLRGAQAYLAYVNAHGGVYGRKVVYDVLDDAYDPSKTVQATRQLVEQEGVLAMFNQIGTEQTLAVRQYLNDRKVPQLFAGTGSVTIASEAAQSPWSMGYLPSFEGEGAVYGRSIAAASPNARIGVLSEDSEYGADLLAGLKRGLGRRAGQIVAAQTYEVTDTDLSSQVSRLKAAGADTFVLFALPKQAIGGFVSASRLGWKPAATYVSSVSIDPAVMKIVKLNGAGALADGAVSSAFLHDPTNPAQARSRGAILYRRIMKRYAAGADPTQAAHMYGMAAAYTLVDTLKRAGRSPTRESVLAAAQHLREPDNPFLLDGIVVRTSPTDYFPIAQTHLVRYREGVWRLVGKLLPVG
jgi:branched-chain amino acid transport system substrate-binding protein